MVMKNGKMMKCLSISGSSHRIYSVEKAVLKNFANVTGKHLCWNLFLMNSYAFRPATLLKWDSKIDLFLVKFTKFLRTPILKNICERLLCISYDLHKYLSHVKKNCQRICAKFMNYLQRFHIIAILENPSKDDLSDSKENAEFHFSKLGCCKANLTKKVLHHSFFSRVWKIFSE